MRQRARDLWEHFRLIIRSATIWLIISIAAFSFESVGMGIVAAFLSAVFFLFRPQLREAQLQLDYDFGTDSAEFLSTLAGATGVPIRAGNKVTLLHSGSEFFPAMLEDIARARYTVTMEQYIFANSEVGWQFARAFCERARAGLSVKLLVDAVGGTLSGAMAAEMQAAGVELAWFHPIRWYNLHRWNNRTHRKSLIIDGHVAYTGGAGLDDHWSASSNSEWSDLQIRIDGPGATPLQSGFATNWLEATGEVITGPGFYPVMKERGGVDVQTILSSPRGDLYTASILYSLAIQCARQCVFITNPYFVPSPRTIDMLNDASERGVDVKVIVAGSHSDTWWARQNSIALYGRLLEAGVEIYEYQPAMLHQKTLVVDSIWATVGTTNFDNRSFAFNEEANVCFYDPDLVNGMRQRFFRDLEASRKISLEEWKKRGWRSEVLERVAAMLRDQV